MNMEMEVPVHDFLDHSSHFTVLIVSYEALGISVTLER